jgi:DnaK suppressor protein
MTRQNALLGFYENLLARRQRLGKKLAGEIAYLHHGKAADATGDSADLAFGTDDDEISSRLAELDDRELGQIESALSRWNQGVYGLCEICNKPISLARLKAIPHAPFCISCVRELEEILSGIVRPRSENWGRISNLQASRRASHLVE